MLWLPVTHGEVLFQNIYSTVGAKIKVESPFGGGIDHLAAPELFVEFTRFVATIEVFLRCIRRISKTYGENILESADQYGRMLWKDEGIPESLKLDKKFCETAKQVGRIIFEEKRISPLEEDIYRSERRQCYLCGILLTKTPKSHNQRTIEHIWPLSLGGETVEGNLLPACTDCNSKRKHAITWAWGPVQSTFHQHKQGTSPPGDLRLSLGMARLMFEASAWGRKRGKITTLKESAKKLWPLVQVEDREDDLPLVYFEMMKKVGEEI